MIFDEYQRMAWETALPLAKQNAWYSALGLGGEAGELLEKIKKLYRDHNGDVDEKRRVEIIRELGDVLWYTAAIATTFDISLNSVALINLSKLKRRAQVGLIKGDGDDREE